MEPADSMKRILVAIDSEGLAVGAVERALRLSDELGSSVKLVHAVDVPPPLWPGVSAKALTEMHASALVAARERVLRELEEARRDSHLRASPVEQLLNVTPGPAGKVIARAAKEYEADLLMLGPHGRRSLFDFGSTARAVLSQSTIPVWTQPAKVEPIRSILVPVDFSLHSRRALRVALQLAEKWSASVRVVHAYSPPVLAYAPSMHGSGPPPYVLESEREQTKRELAAWTENINSVTADWSFVEAGDCVDGILDAARGFDLIVMGTHGRTGLSRFLVGSIAYGVLKRAELPTLVVPSLSRTWLLDGDAREHRARATEQETCT